MLFRPVAQLSDTDGGTESLSRVEQGEGVDMLGGFLRPDFGELTVHASTSSATRLLSPNESAAHRFTAWRGILRFRRSQRDLGDLARGQE